MAKKKKLVNVNKYGLFYRDMEGKLILFKSYPTLKNLTDAIEDKETWEEFSNIEKTQIIIIELDDNGEPKENGEVKE